MSFSLYDGSLRRDIHPIQFHSGSPRETSGPDALVKFVEAHQAADLGASTFRVFWHITLPLSMPGVAVGAFITFVVAIGDYITPKILGGAQELLLPQAIFLQIERAADLPMASTMSMALMVVVTITYFAFAKYLKMDRL